MQAVHCEKCSMEFLSQAALAGHIRQKHPKLMSEQSSSGFDPRKHNIVQGSIHQCADGGRGKVYDTETDTPEGIIFRWRCVECDKILKEWFQKWTPESKERYLKLKEGGLAALPRGSLFQGAIAKIGRKM